MLRSFGNKLKARNGKDRAFNVLNSNTGDYATTDLFWKMGNH